MVTSMSAYRPNRSFSSGWPLNQCGDVLEGDGLGVQVPRRIKRFGSDPPTVLGPLQWTSTDFTMAGIAVLPAHHGADGGAMVTEKAANAHALKLPDFRCRRIRKSLEKREAAQVLRSRISPKVS